MAGALRATWGVTSGVGGVSGVVVGVDIRAEGSFVTETDRLGRVNGVFLFDGTGTFSGDVMIQATESGPDIGQSIEIGGQPCYVKDSQIVETNQSYQKLHVTAERTTLVDSATDKRSEQA